MADTEELPPKLELIAHCPKDLPVSTEVPFDDLRECSKPFQKAYMDAWKV